MYENAIRKCVAFFIQKGIIEEGQQELYFYGLDLVFYSAISIIVILVIAIIIGRFFETLAFLVVFSVLRSFTGGYHAKTRLGCIMTFLASYALVNLLYMLMSKSFQFVLMCVLSAGSIALISVFAPFENENKPFTQKERNIYARRSRIAVWVTGIASVFGLALLPRIAQVFCFITFAAVTCSVSLMVAVILKRGIQNEKGQRISD